MQKLNRKYGLLTAICMVVGTVIGSGLFFKAQNVLIATNGNLLSGIAAWLITGLIMIICSIQFAIMATKYEKINGVVDYAEATCGKGYAYYLAWFMVNIYYPSMTSVLAWVSARYFGVLFGWSLVSAEVLAFSGFFLIASYTINVLSPKLAGKLQTSTTIIKLIPIGLMAIVGTVVGCVNGTLVDNFNYVIVDANPGTGLFTAIVATVFAYEGWIVATSINAELRNPKKNLPIALVIGAGVVVAAYILYYIGIAGGARIETLISEGATTAFSNVFGSIGGIILNVCIVISCLGTLNGLMVATTRGMFSLAVRGEGPNPKMFSQIDQTNNMTTNSAVWGLFLCSMWLLYFYGANLSSSGGWFGLFNFDSSELPIVTLYALYIPIFIAWMKKEKNLSVFKRFVLPILSVLACLFMIFATFYAHGIAPFLNAKEAGKGFSFPILFYLIVFAFVMLIGFFYSDFFKKKIKLKEKEQKKEVCEGDIS